MSWHYCSLVIQEWRSHLHHSHFSLCISSFIDSDMMCVVGSAHLNAAGLWPKLVSSCDYLCAAFKHYTGWCLLSFMWLVSTHDKSMDLLLTLYISKCQTFLFVLQRALICVSCIILFCDRSINSFFRVTRSVHYHFHYYIWQLKVESELFCSKVM